MKKEIAIFISNNYADWEIAFLCPGLNNEKKRFSIKYIAMSYELVISMGGLKVIPDYSIEEYLCKNRNMFHVDLLVLCGGTFWKEQNYKSPLVQELVELCHLHKCLISAICDATTFLAYHSYLNDIKHTGNSLEYFIEQCTSYTGKQHFIESQCCYDKSIITANGTATLEFTKEVMKQLNVYPNEQLEEWYLFNKKGFYQS